MWIQISKWKEGNAVWEGEILTQTKLNPGFALRKKQHVTATGAAGKINLHSFSQPIIFPKKGGKAFWEGEILTQTQLNPGFALRKKQHRCCWRETGSLLPKKLCLLSLEI